MKEAVKDTAGSSGIMSINKKIADKVEQQLQRYVNDAMQQGVDLDTLSPEQLKMIVQMNKPQPPRVIAADSPEGRGITEALFGKRGEVVDMAGKKLDTSQGIMGGKSVKELMDSGQVSKGARGMKKSKKVQDREMFKAANERLTSDVDSIIKDIKSMEPITAMKEANSVIGRKGKYKNLTPEESKKILEDTEDHIFERDIPEDPEDFAKGGRAGFKGGGSDASTTSYSKSFDKQHGTKTASRANRTVDRRQASGQRDADNTNRRMEANRQAGSSEIFPPKETIIDKIRDSRFNNPLTRGILRTGLYTLNPSLGVLDARKAMQLKNAYDLAMTGSLPNTDTEETLDGIEGMTSNLITDTQKGVIDAQGNRGKLTGAFDPDSTFDAAKGVFNEETGTYSLDDKGEKNIFSADRPAEPMTREEFDAYVKEKGYATGGRIGYKLGTGKKGVEGLLDLIRNKFGKKSITTADKAPIPPKTLERKMFKKADENFKNKRMLTDDEYQDFLDEVGGADQLEAYDFDGTVGSAKRILKEQKQYMDDMLMEYKKGNLDPVAGDKSPARKRFLEKKLEEMEASGDKRLMTVDEIEELSSFDLGSEMNVAKSLAPKMVERLQLKQKYPGITDDLLDKILIDDNVQRKAEVLATIDEAFKMMEKGKSSDEILDTMKNVTRTKQADGGITRIGLKGGYLASGAKQLGKKYKGSTLSALLENPRLLGAELGHDGIMEIMNLLPSLFADGGRANFVGGGMGRRGFLKMLAGLGGGIAAAKTGLLKLAGKEPVKQVAKEVVQKSTNTPPPYFFKLAEKIKMLGDDATATTDRTIAKTLKSKDGKSTYVLEEDVTSGDTIIKKINKEGDEMMTDVEIMELKKGEVVMGKNGKPVKVPDEYEEVTEVNARIEGDTFNDPYYSDGIKIDEIIKEIGEQAPSIKKASGGIARMLGE